MVLAEDELIIEEVLFIHKNFEIYTVSDFAKKLNHKKEVVRQAVRQYGFRDFEDGVSKDYFIYKIIENFGYTNENLNMLADYFNISLKMIKNYFNKRG
ncbi:MULTISPECIES: hypothetical protein [unclassified Gemella]|uniref:hypothetical protein n=1 Tax=unclassified Gemella TaxID=2624949 RepID=UPI001073DCA4|nr:MULTISPECIES: hypothetical protein [unclassified Gemella]MBF0709754.1 hypothetical protein [Gemella sp. GL1.1]MBF0747272.1 hypothetical protein [Gemella sp. 19428wG2_WT2a]NYS27098.1 hypothetical protein [Gemella sp. GL1]TFU57857.1 hypothetical protein E4T67_06330 [Gemella sp. WT2a]